MQPWWAGCVKQVSTPSVAACIYPQFTGQMHWYPDACAAQAQADQRTGAGLFARPALSSITR